MICDQIRSVSSRMFSEGSEMKPTRRATRWMASLSVACGLVATAVFPSREGFGQTPPPSSNATGAATVLPPNLLKAQPFDRITLIDNSVWLIEPVAPRPLPVYDPAKAKEAARKEAKKAVSKPSDGNVGTSKKADEKKAEPIPEDIVIHLVEGEIRDYRVKRTSIKKVEYFEDLLLAEGDRLIIDTRDPSNFAKAFEHFLLVKARDPAWKGLDERVDKLLYAEGAMAIVDQDRERGVRLLRELSARKAEFPNLADKLATAYGGRINESFERGQFPYARKVLHDLELISPQNPLIKETRDRFIAKAKGLVDIAMTKQGAERLDGLSEALRVWPTFEGASEKYDEAFRQLPTLDVAVIDLPRPAGPFIRSPAGERVAKLLYLPLLANESEEAVRGKLTSQLVTNLEVGDIGRQVDLRLRDDVRWSDDSRRVSAIDAVRALSDRAQPRSPGYSARWADLLERVEITDEQQVTVKFTRPILKPESWFLNPVGPAHAAWDGRVPASDGKRRPVGDGPFVSDFESEASASYAASPSSSESNADSPLKLKRLREVRMSSGSAALGALVRGEVSLVEHVPSDRVAALQSDPEIRMGSYSLPSLHRLAIDGRNPNLRNRSLRRGIAYAINRKALLEETVLKAPIDAINTPSDGPFAIDSYANAPEVKPYEPDLLLARMLVAAGKKELNASEVKLTLEYPAIPEAQSSVPRIAEALRTVGFVVTIIERSESELEDALRAGRRFDLAYRVSRCVEPVWDAGPMLCPGYDAPSRSEGLAALASPRILQLLLQLEHAQDWNSAKELATQIDRESRDELPVIPLWQLQDHFAYRARLKGPAETASHLYQGIDQWQMEPWFAKDPW